MQFAASNWETLKVYCMHLIWAPPVLLEARLLHLYHIERSMRSLTTRIASVILALRSGRCLTLVPETLPLTLPSQVKIRRCHVGKLGWPPYRSIPADQPARKLHAVDCQHSEPQYQSLIRLMLQTSLICFCPISIICLLQIEVGDGLCAYSVLVSE